jgi:hypothetical protein
MRDLVLPSLQQLPVRESDAAWSDLFKPSGVTMRDPLFIDPKEIPTGFDYQWASLSVMGDEKLGDFERMKAMGWRPVPAKRHWDLESARGIGSVINLDGFEAWGHNGLVLVERNMKLTERAKLEGRDRADAQMGFARSMRQYREAIPTDFRMGYDLPDDDRGIDPYRPMPIVSHLVVYGAYTWTDKLTLALWLSGWRYVPADRHVEYFTNTNDPQRKLVLFYDKGKARYLIWRKRRDFTRPAADWLQRLMFWKRR